MRAYLSIARAVTLLSITGIAGIAAATGPDPPSPPPQNLGAPIDAPRTIDGFGAAVDSIELAALRGGDTVTSTIVTNGTVTDNHAENIVTGSNTITGGAFDNSAGVTSVIQNTGANVLIQNAMIINVQFADPGP